MLDNARIEDLRRRVEKDPASIAFAQLAEEYRRAGELQQSVDTSRAGLAIHPDYRSARVTLGRALVELGQLDEAKSEFTRVLTGAPENLAAIRGLAEILRRSGAAHEALALYRAALSLAPNDPSLEETVSELTRELVLDTERQEPDEPSSAGGEQEVLACLPTRSVAAVCPSEPAPATAAGMPAQPAAPEPARTEVSTPLVAPTSSPTALADAAMEEAARSRADRTIVALDEWLAAIHAARADRHA